MSDRPNTGLGSWRVRRRFMLAIIAFCMWAVAYVLVEKVDTRAAETAVMSAFLCMIGTMGSYVFGATWQDINTQAVSARSEAERRRPAARPAATPVAQTTTTTTVGVAKDDEED